MSSLIRKAVIVFTLTCASTYAETPRKDLFEVFRRLSQVTQHAEQRGNLYLYQHVVIVSEDQSGFYLLNGEDSKKDAFIPFTQDALDSYEGKRSYLYGYSSPSKVLPFDVSVRFIPDAQTRRVKILYDQRHAALVKPRPTHLNFVYGKVKLDPNLVKPADTSQQLKGLKALDREVDLLIDAAAVPQTQAKRERIVSVIEGSLLKTVTDSELKSRLQNTLNAAKASAPAAPPAAPKPTTPPPKKKN